MCGKNCFVIVIAHELINYRLIIKKIKASNAFDVVKQFSYEMDNLSMVT